MKRSIEECNDDDLVIVRKALEEASVDIHRELSAHIGYHTSVAFKSDDGRPKTKNASGDKQAPLDVVSDRCVENALRKCDLIAGFASEERKDFVSLNSTKGKFVIVFDPLDGSQNLPVGLSVGSIFGVFRAKSLKDISSGLDLVAAGYSLYSASLQFVWTSLNREGAVLSQYDFSKKTWIVATRKHMQPVKGKTYCINEGSASNWNEDIRVLVSNHLKGRSIRWMACMVADVHRPLMEGGGFLYPCDKKYTKGRLRLVYEAYPMAFVWEKCTQNGGVAVCRHKDSTYDRILKVPFPHDDVHSRCGVILLGPTEAKMFQKSVELASERGADWGKF